MNEEAINEEAINEEAINEEFREIEMKEVNLDDDDIKTELEEVEESPNKAQKGKNGSLELQKVEPLKIVHYIINYPCTVICSFLFLCLIMIIIDSFVFEISASDGREWFVNDAVEVHKFDTLLISPRELADSITDPADPQTQLSNWLTIVTLFKTRDNSNILQPRYLSYIKEINEKIIHSNYEEYSKLCLIDSLSSPNCSSTAYVDPLIQSIIGAGYDFDTITDSELSAVIDGAINNYGDQFYLHFEESFATSIDRESRYYRTFYRFGLPYPDIDQTHSSFRSKGDNFDKQEIYYDSWMVPIVEDIQLNTNNHDKIEVVIFGNQVHDSFLNYYLQRGNLFAGGSMLIVWLIMFIHMKSLFLSSAAMLQIILGFPLSYFFYGVVFQVNYFGSLQFIVIFVILGIAADDCFVMCDAWAQSENIVQNSHNITERMSYTYRRATYAMLVTTSTTAIAFLATSLSPIIPIASFGIWASIVVTVNYMCMLTYFPACLSWYFQNLRKYEKWCCSCFKKPQLLSTLSRSVSISKKKIVEKDISRESGPNDIKRSRTTLPSLVLQDGKRNKSAVKFETFLRDIYSRWILKYKYIILTLFIALISVSLWKSTQLEGLSEQEKFFQESHWMRKLYTYQDKFYAGNTQALITPYLTYGIDKMIDRTGTDKWDITDLGKIQYDDTFDISSVESQQFIYDICEELKSQHNDRIFQPETELNCFIYDMINYANTTYNMEFPLSFSSDPQEQKEQFTEFIATWTANDARGKLLKNDAMIGYFENENKLKFIVISWKLKMFRWGQYDEKKEEFDFWEEKMEEWNNNPLSPSKGFQTSVAWAWMTSEIAFVTSAVQGGLIALPAAFIVLLLSTHNWILSIFAITTIVGILSSEVAIMVFQGWQLGVTESIAVVIMIGFSIDYVVHFACSYIECPYSIKRDSRLRYSLYTMGISILYGCITTFGAGFFLIFPEMLFFKKFGTLIMCVVVLSLVYASGFFMALLAIKGPIGNQGNIPFKKIWNKVLCKKNE